jgi:hypothetical protein
VHTLIPALEAEAGRPRVRGQPGLRIKNLSQNTRHQQQKPFSPTPEKKKNFTTMKGGGTKIKKFLRLFQLWENYSNANASFILRAWGFNLKVANIYISHGFQSGVRSKVASFTVVFHSNVLI